MRRFFAFALFGAALAAPHLPSEAAVATENDAIRPSDTVLLEQAVAAEADTPEIKVRKSLEDIVPDASGDLEKRKEQKLLAVLPPGFTPPPLNLPLGGVRTYAPIQTKNKITKFSSKTQRYTHTVAPVVVNTRVVRAKDEKRALDELERPALELPDGGVVTFSAPPSQKTVEPVELKREVRTDQPSGYTPPAPTFQDGGHHTLAPGSGRGRLAGQHVSFKPGSFSNTAISGGIGSKNSKFHARDPENPEAAEELVERAELDADGKAFAKRDDPTPTSAPDDSEVITTITPSPGAPGIPITEQGQVVTSYIPITNCDGTTGNFFYTPTTCETSYSPTITPICDTAVSPLGAPAIPITDCYQYVTYSSEYGYSFIPQTTPAPGSSCLSTSLQTRTTFYAAFWTDLNPGILPQEYVKGIVCRDGYCGTAAVTFVLPTPTPGVGVENRLQNPLPSNEQNQGASKAAKSTAKPAASPAPSNPGKKSPPAQPAPTVKHLQPQSTHANKPAATAGHH